MVHIQISSASKRNIITISEVQSDSRMYLKKKYWG